MNFRVFFNRRLINAFEREADVNEFEMQTRQVIFADAPVADNRLCRKTAVLFDDLYGVADIQL